MIMYVLFAIYLVKTLSPIIFTFLMLYWCSCIKGFLAVEKNSGVGMVMKFEIDMFDMTYFHSLQAES